MRHLIAVISDELIDSSHTRVITNTICSARRSFHDGFKLFFLLIFLSLFIPFRTNIRMSIIYLSPRSFLFALYLDWSLNTRVDKKSNAVFIFAKLCSTLVWHKLSIIWSLVLFSLEMHNRSRKKLTGKKLNVDRQFFKDALCVTLLQEGVGQYQLFGKIATYLPHFHY